MRRAFFIMLIAIQALASGLWAGPRVIDGTLDLREWNGRDSMDLSGLWLSAENQLLDGPAATALSAEAWTPIPVPTSGPFPQEITQGQAQRTYRLRILGLRHDHALGLYIHRIRTSVRFILYQPHTQQQDIFQELGRVDAANEKRVPVYTANNFARLPRAEGEAILLVQATARIFDQKPLTPFGLVEKLQLGPADVFEKKARQHYYEVFLVLGLFLLLVVFNLALFIQRPTEKANLYLSFFALCFGLRYIGTEGVLAQWVVTPTLGQFYMQNVLTLFSPTLANIGLGLFLCSTFPRQVPRIMPAFGVAILLYQLATSLIISLNFTQSQFVPQTLILLALFLVYCGCIFRATRAREEGAMLGLWGFGMVFACHLNDFCVAILGFPSIYLGQYSLVFLIFNQSLIVGRRFALTFDRMQIMSAELQTQNTVLEEKQREIGMLNTSLQEYAQTLEEKVEEKTRVVKGLLDHIPQGVLSIGSKGIIANDSSAHLMQIFENREVTGQPFKTAILDACDMDADVRDQIWQTILACMDSHVLSFDVNADKLPPEMIFLGQQKKILRVTWNMRSKHHLIDSILVTFLDITAEKALEIETQKQQKEIQRIQQLVEISAEKSHQFFSTSAPLLQEIQDTLQFHSERLDKDRIKLLFVNAHTVKGASRTLRLHALTETIHALESEYSLILKDNRSIDIGRLRSDIHEVMATFRDYIRINEEKLNRTFDNSTVAIERDFLEEHYHLIKDFIGSRSLDHGQFIEAFHAQANRLAGVIFEELPAVFDDYKDMAKKVAKDIGREEPLFDFNIPPLSLSYDNRAILDKCMIHLIRNALDHGIESGEERQRRGKPARGTLFCHATVEGDALQLIIKDDGKGLALRALHEKGLKSGRLHAKSSPLDMARTIFESGTSTAHHVTTDSGRGIGMSAVLSFLNQTGGTIEIVLGDEKLDSPGYYDFHFTLTFPPGENTLSTLRNAG
ncbi:MAG TPA: 7TM diverse intracellular signaling domain-containing protein [Oligoflexus sp.]|uniref:7TM diverse intracellular signaling domain-containing protein n=1 Tax=Oligoflexus sp. TaxID=1971216 RepID=UPI002D461AF1|nr:7TM diverse intracellular signaling domain-containing protein [Oligoflexus sp.]HYX36248.1 7TM diverse intracellular signaling domain-containing protein [Oligoflexus sp.]